MGAEGAGPLLQRLLAWLRVGGMREVGLGAPGLQKVLLSVWWGRARARWPRCLG